MAPLLISAVTSMASSIIDKWNQTNEAPALQEMPRVAFDSILKTRSLAGASLVQAPQPTAVTDALMQQLVSSPEVASALNGQNLPPGSQLEFATDGGLSLRLPNGYTQALNLRPETQMLAAQVRASMAGAQ